MTSALMPILPGPAPAASSTASAGADVTSGAATAALDFSGILLAMLPFAAALPASDAGGGESQNAGAGTGKQAKPKDADQQPDQIGERPAEDPAKTVPLTAIVPLPVLPQLTTPLPDGDGRTAAESDTPGPVALPDQAGRLATLTEMPALPAQIAIPAVAAEASSVDPVQMAPTFEEAVVDAAPRNASPVADATTLKPAGPELKTSTTTGKSDLAFAARLTTSPTPPPEPGRSPQLHPAIPPETLSAKPEAQPAPPQISGASAGAPTDVKPAAPADAPLKPAPVAMPVETEVRTPPAESEGKARPSVVTAADAAPVAAIRPDASKAASPAATPAAVQPAREHRGQEFGADQGSGGGEQRPSGESLFPTVAAARVDGQAVARPELISREHATGAAASAGAVETQPLRPEAPAQPVREVSVVVPGRVASNGRPGPDVEVRVVERTGEMHVTVRTADSQLSNSLRENLPQMVSELADRGYRAETWHPGAGAVEGGVVRTENAAAESGSDGGFRQPGRGGSDTAGQGGGQGGQRRDQQNAPEWLEALERSMGSAQGRSRSAV